MTSDAKLPAFSISDAPSLARLINSLAGASRQSSDNLRLTLAQQLLNSFWQTDSNGLAPFDPQLEAATASLRQKLESWIASDESFYLQEQHPLRLVLAQLSLHLSHWCPRDSKPSQQFSERVNELGQQLQADAQSGTAQLNEFIQWADKEAKRASMLASRLGESEAGEMRLLAVECQVLDALNEHLANRAFPDEAQPGLIAILKSELQHSLVTAGEDQESAAVWKYWQRLLPILGQVFYLEGDTPDDQFLYAQIPPLVNELGRSVQLPLSHPETYGRWVDDLCQYLMLAIQKKSVACSQLAPLAYPEGFSSSQTRVTQSVMQLSQSLQLGDWLAFEQQNHAPLRCQLAFKNLQSDQLLFVDQAGRKVMSKSLKDTALCLSTGNAHPISTAPLALAIQNLLTKLQQQGQKLHEQMTAMANSRAQKAAAEEAARRKAETEAAERAMQEQLEIRRAASRKAMAEAKALAEEKERRMVEEKRLLEQKRQADLAEAEARQLAAIEAISQLKVGAWLELQQEDGKFLRAKLSVILASTGKYIFVDQVGRKLAEHQRDQLIGLHQQQQLKVLRQGGDFEDQLAKVIRGLRKDITP